MPFSVKDEKYAPDEQVLTVTINDNGKENVLSVTPAPM